jgi:uncharacterized membrane protein YhhN
MVAAIAFTLVALGALVLAERRDLAGLQRVSKLAASTGFLATAWAGGALDHDFGRTMFAALLACAVGDACLLSRARPWFLAGLVAFALGHLGYTLAFAERGIDVGIAVPVGIALVLPAWVVWRVLGPHVPADMRLPVLGYIGIITAMVACAWSCDGGDATWGIRIGATMFYASDLSVARDVFVRRAFVNRLWGLPAYYVAQLLLAAASSR